MYNTSARLVLETLVQCLNSISNNDVGNCSTLLLLQQTLKLIDTDDGVATFDEVDDTICAL